MASGLPVLVSDWNGYKSTVRNIETSKNWKGFYNWFNDSFGKRGLPTLYLYTEGNELLLPNRTNYVGYYHIMEGVSRGLMTGRFHGEAEDIPLTPITS